MTATAQSFTAEERRGYIGASEIPAILGLDKYKTPIDLYNEKCGLVEPFTGNKHTERGNRLEAIAAEYYTEITGVAVRRRSAALQHPEHAFIVGHVDRVAVGEKRLVEIKCPSTGMFRKLQREGLPESYLIQAHTYMGLGGFPKLTFVIFCADVWDAAVFDIDFDETIYNAAIGAAVAFWTEHVTPGIPPRADTVPHEIEMAKTGGSVSVRDDETFVAKCLALKEATDLKRDAEELLEIAKKDLIDAFDGEPGAYEVPGLARIYYTQTAGRVTFDKKALAAAHPELDLEPFNKQGKPFNTLRTYFEG